MKHIFNKIELSNDNSSILFESSSRKKRSDFILEIIKLENKFCKNLLKNNFGLDFEVDEDESSFKIKIIGESGEEFLRLIFTEFSTNKSARLFFEFNEDYFPLKKELLEKKQLANVMFYKFAKNELSFI